MNRHALAIILLSVIIYAAVIGSNFDPAVRAKQVEAFGAAPFGLPVTVVVGVAETVLYVPMPWIFWHLMRIAFQASQDGRRLGIGYLLTVGNLHPHLWRSQIVCFAGAAYFLSFVVAWAVYAGFRDI